jgi:HSP20 family protein
VINIVSKKLKKEKLTIIPKERKGLIARRPNDFWTDIDRPIDRLRQNFDEFFWNPETNFLALPDYRTPVMDVVDLGDKYEMHVEMPGIKKEDINIDVAPNMVEICAEHKETKEDKGKNWLRQERSTMDFYRHLELPEELKTKNVEAELKDGVLTLSLPKAQPKERFQSTKVKIK